MVVGGLKGCEVGTGGGGGEMNGAGDDIGRQTGEAKRR